VIQCVIKLLKTNRNNECKPNVGIHYSKPVVSNKQNKIKMMILLEIKNDKNKIEKNKQMGWWGALRDVLWTANFT
jgi:hypothetical protein